MSNWVPVGDGKTMRCPDHPQAPHWARGRGRCVECPPPGAPELVVVDASVPDTLEAAVRQRAVRPPSGCLTVDAYEARLNQHGTYCEQQSRKVVDAKRKSRPSESIAVKWAAEATKAWRAAAELAIPREKRGRRRWKEDLAADIRAMRKRRGSAN